MWILPGVAGMIVCGVKLFELFPGQVRDGQRLSSRDDRVRVLRVQLILKILGIQLLVVRLEEHTQRNTYKAPFK